MVARVPCTECAVSLQTIVVGYTLAESLMKQAMGRTALSRSLALKQRTSRSIYADSDFGFSGHTFLATAHCSSGRDTEPPQPTAFDASDCSHHYQAKNRAYRANQLRDPMCVPYDPPPLFSEAITGAFDEDMEAESDSKSNE